MDNTFTGPGDDILDAIEKGTDDKHILSKYNLNADQLKAFKSLHYGLSNKKMSYDEISDYFPDLDHYFKLGPYYGPQKNQQPVDTNTGIPKPDFTKPVKEKLAVESTAAPGIKKHFQAEAESGKAGETVQEKFDKETQNAKKNLFTEINKNDDVVEKMIRQGRYKVATEQTLNQLAQASRSDMPAAAQLALQRQQYNEPEVKAQDLPVSSEDIASLKNDIQNNEGQARHFINQVVLHKPEKAQELQSSMYMLDAENRLKANPDAGLKVYNNLVKLKNGELKYNAETGQVIKELGPIDALIHGVQERSREMSAYDTYQGKDEDVTKSLESQYQAHDPDEPTLVPQGAGELTQMLGMEWKSLLKGSIISAAANALGNPEVAPGITAIANAGEYYKRGFATAMEDSYKQLRASGKTPEEAFTIAKQQAKDEATLNAVEGAISTFAGGAIGLKPLPKVNVSAGFKNAASQLLKETVHYAGHTSIEGLTNGLISGYLQEQKNKAAEEKGIFRPEGQGVKEAITGQLTFALAIGGVSKFGSKLIDPGTYKKLMYYLGRQPEDIVSTGIDKMVAEGQLKPEVATDIKNRIAEQKKIDATIPEDIKDVSRMAMHDKINKRNELEKEIETTDKALHPPLKEEIKDLDLQILEHSKHKKTENESETETDATKAEAETGDAVLKKDERGAGEKSLSGEPAPLPKEEVKPNIPMAWKHPDGTEYRITEGKLNRVTENGKEIPVTNKIMPKNEAEEISEIVKLSNGQGDINKLLELLPQDQWQILRNGLKGKNVNTLTEMANHYKSGDAAVVKHVNDFFNIKPKLNAIQEQGGAGVHVPTSSSYSKALGKGNESAGPINERSAGTQEIKSIDDFESRLHELLGKSKLEQKPGEVDKEKGFKSPEEFLNKAQNVLKELFPDHKVDVYNSEKEYLSKEGLKSRSYGFYSSSEKRIAYNFEGIKQDRKNTTVYHEIIHPILDEVFGKNNDALDRLYTQLEKLGNEPGMEKVWDHFNKYYARGGKVQKIEGLTEFLALTATGGIDTSKLPESTVNKLIDFINKLFEKVGINYKIDSALDLKTLSSAITQSFEKETAAPLKSLIGEPQGAGKGEKQEMLANQEDAIKDLIKSTHDSVSDEDIKNSIVKATGMKEADVQKMIDEVRGKYEDVSREQQAVYDNTIGAKPTSGGRITVDPIVGGERKNIKDIIKAVSVGLKQPLIYAKTGRSGSGGAYYPGFKGIKIRYNGDLAVTAHELGHAIDDHFNFYDAVKNNPQAMQELMDYSNESHASTPPTKHPDPMKYTIQEGFAEWMRNHVVNPKQAKQLGPEINKVYESVVSKEFQHEIKKFSDDVRSFNGSGGINMIKANVEFEPSNPKGILGKLLKKEDTNSEYSFNWANRLAANFINPLQAFEKAFKYAKGVRGLGEILPENDPIILSRILNGIDGKFGEILKHGMIDGKLNVLKTADGKVKNLQWLIEPLDNTDVSTIKKDMEDVIAYMIAERTVELSKKFERGNILTGIGGGMVSDFSVAQKALSEFDAMDPARLDRIKDAANRYREFADDVLKYAVDKGRLSQDQYDQIKEDNVQYVALQRVLETQPGHEIIVYENGPGGKLGSKGEITKKIKGSTKEITNPYVPLLDTLYKTIRESDRNDVLRAFRDMLVNDRGMNQGKAQRIADIGIISNQATDESIPIFVDGKAEHWIFQKDLYKALKGLDAEAYRLPGVVKMPADMLRLFTTHFPTFAVRNWVRDTQDRIIKTTTGSGFKELVGNKEDWNTIARAGGLNTGFYLKTKQSYYGLLNEAMHVMAKDKKFILADPAMLKHMWHKYSDLLYKSETSNRVAEYRSAFKEGQAKGMDNYNAALYGAYKARDLIDFAIMGHYMKVINQIIPFSNAAVQGLRSGAVSFAKNPLAFAGRMAIYSIIPGMAAWAWNHRNKEDADQYEEIPGYQRDMFWNFRIGPNNWLSVPKPYELSLPAAGIERLMSQSMGYKNAFEGFGSDIKQLLLPFDEGNISGPFQVLIEELTNHDFFRNRTIVPVGEEALDLSLRHTETASRLGQLLQKYTGIDARKIDYFFQRQFSYTGSFVVKASDIGVKGSRHEFDFTDTGLFKRSPAYNSISVQKMISFAKTWDLAKSQQYKGFNSMVADYFKATDNTQKEEIGKKLIEASKEILQDWKKNEVPKLKQERAEEKKAMSK